MAVIRIIETEDGSHSLYHEGLRESYHSLHGALQESQHVFIKEGLEFSIQQGRENLRILEVGFGTGLNALLTLLYAEEKGITLRYEGLEPEPVETALLEKINYPSCLSAYPEAGNFFNTLHQQAWEEELGIGKHFRLKKIKRSIQDCPLEGDYDLIYFDAFAPSKQAEMWDLSIIQKLSEHLAMGATLVTYCAQGQFKRNLKACGLDVVSLPGPPGKKEMTRAIKTLS